MPPSDSEPRYRLVDSSGNVVGSFFVNADGNVEIQDETATGTVFDSSGLSTEQVSASSASVSGTGSFGAVETETIGAGDYHYAGDYPGATPDDRLGNAIADSGVSSAIFLEREQYSTNRTFSDNTTLVGPTPEPAGAEIEATWTFDGRVKLSNAFIDSNSGGEIVLNSVVCRLTDLRGSSGENVTVASDRAIIATSDTLTITFQSGTSGGVVDSCTSTTVTDNGINTVGDVV